MKASRTVCSKGTRMGVYYTPTRLQQSQLTMGSNSSKYLCGHSDKKSNPLFMNTWTCSSELLPFLVNSNTASLSDSDSDEGLNSLHPSLADNIMKLPSAFSDRGHQIRHVETNVDNSEEKLVRVKRRARVVRAILASEDIAVESDTLIASSLDPPHTNGSTKATTHDFAYLRVLGKGATGMVVLVRHKLTQKLYAMKIVSKQSIREKNLVTKILSERDILGGTQHPLLVHLHWAFQTANYLLLVTEFCSGGEICTHLQMLGRFTETVARFYAAQLVLALEHLHRHGIVYRDLKPENILLSESGHLKLIDFGLSKFGVTEANNGANTLCGSWEYVAPEVLEGCEYGTAVDWWSFGAVLYEFLTGLPPWYCQNLEKMRRNILKCPLQFPHHVSVEAENLIRGLLSRNPSKRLGTTHGSMELKQHIFFCTTDWEMMSFQEVQPPIQPIKQEFRNLERGVTSLSKSMTSTSFESPHDEFHDFDFRQKDVLHVELGNKLDHGEKRVVICRKSVSSEASQGPT